MQKNTKKLPQRKPEKFMSDKEIIKKLEEKIYGKPKPDMERLSEAVKNKLKDFDRFSIN